MCKLITIKKKYPCRQTPAISHVHLQTFVCTNNKHTNIHTHVHTRTHTEAHSHTSAVTHSLQHTHTFSCLHTQRQVRNKIHMYTSTCKPRRTYGLTCICIHTHTHTHTHTYMHAISFAQVIFRNVGNISFRVICSIFSEISLIISALYKKEMLSHASLKSYIISG